MPINVGQLMVTGSENPDSSQRIGGVTAGTGISITPTGTISVNPAEQVSRIVAGANITVTPSSGFGEVTLSYTPALTATEDFPAGTKMFFLNASAPLYWTQDTSSVNDGILRLVSTAGGGTGGSLNYSSTFVSNVATSGSVSVNGSASGSTGDASITWSGSVSVGGSVGATALSAGQSPGESGSFGSNVGSSGTYNFANGNFSTGGATANSGKDGGQKYTTVSYSFGSGGSHTHSLSGSGSYSGNNSNHSHSWSGSLSGSGTFTGSTIDLNLKYINIIQCTFNGLPP
jgi:hypothetical protein